MESTISHRKLPPGASIALKSHRSPRINSMVLQKGNLGVREDFRRTDVHRIPEIYDRLRDLLDLEIKQKRKPYLRIRFRASLDDPRPLNWPIKYPYWISGEDGSHAILVAYADSKEYIKENWPEASILEVKEFDQLEFTDRFPKPDWFKQPAVSKDAPL